VSRQTLPPLCAGQLSGQRVDGQLHGMAGMAKAQLSSQRWRWLVLITVSCRRHPGSLMGAICNAFSIIFLGLLREDTRHRGIGGKVRMCIDRLKPREALSCFRAWACSLISLAWACSGAVVYAISAWESFVHVADAYATNMVECNCNYCWNP
jgi:hypothetical protein